MKKNIIAIMMAVVALFATQCKKQTEPMANNPAGETMEVTVRVENDAAKTEITAGAVTWEEGDKLYVVGANQGLLGYVSAVTGGKSVNFEGRITPLASGQVLHFYYVGDQEFTLDADGNYTFDLSSQDGTLEGIGAHNQLMFGTTSGTVNVGTTNFGTISMTSLMAIAHLNIVFPETDSKVDGYKIVKVAGGRTKLTFNAKSYNTEDFLYEDGTITMESTAPITDCYIALLPGEQTFSFRSGMFGGSLNEKEVEANKFYNSQNPISVTMTETTPPPALFTIDADGHQVYFSPGNLWCDNTYPAAPKWYFENNQYDYHTFGTNANVQNGVTSTNVDGCWGLFAWSCSAADCNYGMYAKKTSPHTMGTFKEWGENPIENGGQTTNQWRTLTSGRATDNGGGEWNYLLIQRTDAYRYVLAQVHGINGLIIFPDNWENNTTAAISFNNINDKGYYVTNGDKTGNEIDDATWTLLEYEGCVFLPAVGNRTTAMLNENNGFYWGSGKYSSSGYYTKFLEGTAITAGTAGVNHYYGCAVRLVKDAN